MLQFSVFTMSILTLPNSSKKQYLELAVSSDFLNSLTNSFEEYPDSHNSQQERESGKRATRTLDRVR